MAFELVVFLGLALALGFKHAYDADHLLAVSNLLARSQSLRKTTLMSVSWAAGHMITATIVTVLLFVFRETLLRGVLAYLELGVAVMLVVLGVFGILAEFHVIHIHAHEHGGDEHAHAHLHLRPATDHAAMFGIGIVHGLASNDELLLLFVVSLSVTTLAGLLGGVGIFSVGVVLGMVVFSLGMVYPARRWGTERTRRAVSLAAALLSIGYAVVLFLGYGGINLLPIL